MGTLSIASEPSTDTDYNGLAETVNVYSATIDGRPLTVRHVAPQATADATARTDFKTTLTKLGYEWTSEV